MINGIKPIISKPKPKLKIDIKTEIVKPSTNGLSFDDAMTNLLENIQADYDNWRDGCKYGSMKKMNL